MKSLNACLLFGCLLLGSFSGSAKTDLATKAHGYLIDRVKQTKAPSLSVAAGHNGKLLFAVAHGIANKAKDIKATVNTQYRTGSVSKVIATTAFMPLVEQNRVKLNDKITQK